MPSKCVNPLLPFVLGATSVFSDDVDETIEDHQFLRALRTLAWVEERLGQAAFEQRMATVARSVSRVAWAQLLEGLEAAQAPPGDASVQLSLQ